jgi:hypothetical protein
LALTKSDADGQSHLGKMNTRKANAMENAEYDWPSRIDLLHARNTACQCRRNGGTTGS